MNDFNQDMQSLLNAYDSNWEDYLILREQFIEKYSLSVEKLQEQLNTAKKALTEITKMADSGDVTWNEDIKAVTNSALAAIGGDDDRE
ncbi:hypothetical protein IL308_09880 [Lactococcus lactis]|uniref:hypothetical protein n=1 Tax=Lactococcus lactis TaxID=1358 RepID=UPI001912F6D0|nr:hypothetical protein [Lactococcus lactis]MBK5077066.1 hypothetical protein [Lactococcus lactis]